jgi:NAD(P)-dependent dehydrogenase (short-subunit alcohol dehydrogenase family)
VAATSAITSGTLDVLIASAALMRDWSAFDPFSVLSQEPSRLTTELMDMFNTNVVGNIHLINLFMPLILKGNLKKVIAITSGMADTSLVVKHNIYEGAPYSISKAALNMAVAKFQAEYEKDGVLFMAVCPGAVNTGQYDTSMFIRSCNIT